MIGQLNFYEKFLDEINFLLELWMCHHMNKTMIPISRLFHPFQRIHGSSIFIFVIFPFKRVFLHSIKQWTYIILIIFVTLCFFGTVRVKCILENTHVSELCVLHKKSVSRDCECKINFATGIHFDIFQIENWVKYDDYYKTLFKFQISNWFCVLFLLLLYIT